MKLLAAAILVLALLVSDIDSKRDKVHPKKVKGKKVEETTSQPALERRHMSSVISTGVCDDGKYQCTAGPNLEHYDPIDPHTIFCIKNSWICEEYRYCDCADCADEQCIDGIPIADTTATTAAATTSSTGSVGGSACGQSAPMYPPALNIVDGEIVGLPLGIVGGGEALPHSYPWLVRLNSKSQSGAWYVCGGSLINNQWILTAAHCVYEDDDVRLLMEYRALLGAHDTRNTGNWHTIDYVVAHPYYKKQYGEYGGLITVDTDVALLKLSAPVEFNDKIKPICLPDAMSDYRFFQGKVLATGWGGTEAYVERSPQSNVLKQLVLSVEECASQAISPMRICAASSGVSGSTCGGDSGGPLAALVDGKFTQIGIASYALATCAEGTNGGYAHVPNAREWIAQETGV